MSEKKIHVLYIITKLELGGAQKVCLSLFQNLTDHDATATLLSGAQGPLVQTVQNNPNVILLAELKHNLSLFSCIQEISCFFAMIRAIKKIKKEHPDLIVHTHSTKAGILGRWAAFFAGVTIRVHTVHGYAFHKHQNKIKWLLIYLAELITSLITTHFVCVSSHDIKTGTKLFPRFAKKHSLIRAAVDWQQFYLPAHKATSWPGETPFIFGTVACFKPQKNLFDLLKAFTLVHLKNPNTRLEIIGDGTLRSTLETWIENHALKDAVILHGWQEKVAPLMLTWNSFVLSSLWEGLPCAIVEARLLQLPVLSYNTGGIADIIHHGKNGFLFEQGNWRALAAGMLSVTQDATLYATLQQHQEDLYDFNDNHMTEHHARLYNDLLKNP
jgi:glycosyltransferase involved in cell wall biosynthesis